MAWYWVMAASVIFTVGGIILYNILDGYNDWIGFCAGFIGGIFILVSILVVVVAPINANSDFESFVAKKAFIESQDGKGLITNYELLQQKLGLNSWLLNEQSFKKANPNWSFAPDAIMELEPIEY